MFKLGEYLQKQGHEVQYFGMEHEGRCVGNAVGAYTKDMDFHGGSRLAKFIYPIKTIYNMEARKKIRMILDDFQPDVCHLNNFNYQLTPSIILEIAKWRKQTGRKCRIIYTAHDYQLVCPNHMLYNPNTQQICEKCLGGHFENCVKGRCIHGSAAKSVIGALEGFYWKRRRVYERIDAIVCPSDFMKSKLDTNPLLKEKTMMLHNFVDKSQDTWDDEERKKEIPSLPDKYVLYFGRYSVEKGIETLLKVCGELSEINFVFAGAGPLEEKIGKVQNITNVGFQTGKNLKELISNALFTVYPCEWYENCPFSVLESQMCGTPVLGANIGGVPELIENEKTGVLFEAGNVEQLSQAIEILWKEKGKIETMSDNCFGWGNVCLDDYVGQIKRYIEDKNL